MAEDRAGDLADQGDERWPYLLSRDLLVRPTDDLDDLLDSHPQAWTDQRLRGVEPYWKGPELAAMIEREYPLKP